MGAREGEGKGARGMQARAAALATGLQRGHERSLERGHDLERFSGPAADVVVEHALQVPLPLAMAQVEHRRVRSASHHVLHPLEKWMGGRLRVERRLRSRRHMRRCACVAVSLCDGS